MKKKALFIAATGQNVGKTTTCLGLLSGLKKKFQTVGFMKPVGQEHVEIENNQRVDKDVVLFKNHFGIKDTYSDMSPVLIPRGFTRDFLDGKIEHQYLIDRIQSSFTRLTAQNMFTIVEGTGHIGVGSIVNLNNAEVAKLLEIDVILICSGGLGSSFDELILNKILCDKYKVNIVGIILNRVLPEKKEMIQDYMQKALLPWKIPILGCIPFNNFLSTPAMEDFEDLFQTKLMAGEEYRMRHFQNVRLVATSVEKYKDLICKNQLIITPASREDIILAILTKYWDLKIASPDEDLESGMILTGTNPPKPSIIDQIKRANIPMLYAPLTSYITMKMITNYTAKIHESDVAKVLKAIKVVETHIDFDLIENLISTPFQNILTSI